MPALILICAAVAVCAGLLTDRRLRLLLLLHLCLRCLQDQAAMFEHTLWTQADRLARECGWAKQFMCSLPGVQQAAGVLHACMSPYGDAEYGSGVGCAQSGSAVAGSRLLRGCGVIACAPATSPDTTHGGWSMLEPRAGFLPSHCACICTGPPSAAFDGPVPMPDPGCQLGPDCQWLLRPRPVSNMTSDPGCSWPGLQHAIVATGLSIFHDPHSAL